MPPTRAPHNRTLTCSAEEEARFAPQLVTLGAAAEPCELLDRIVHQDFFQAAPFLPHGFTDLVVMDPPYNLSKNYHGQWFKEKQSVEYALWFESVIGLLKPTLKANGTLYVCSDWRTSILIAPILEAHFHVRNRITWEREKGRGAKENWKNNTEDIWFCTVSEKYHFDVDAVKLKRRVKAPYRDGEGNPKGWDKGVDGNYRLTYPSNIWNDITIPFWSMPENTDHPTQKPEKLIAKLILASTPEGGVILDPFLGSGTTAVVSRKLKRHFVGIEQNREYCCWAQKRLERAAVEPTIQGYADGVFWERNSLSEQRQGSA